MYAFLLSLIASICLTPGVLALACWWPCCEPEGELCGGMCSDPIPDEIKLICSGMAPGDCSDCSGVEGTFVLTTCPFGDICQRGVIFSSTCSSRTLWRISYLTVAFRIIARVQNTIGGESICGLGGLSGFYNQFFIVVPEPGFPCHEFLELAPGDGSLCNHSAATVTIEPN